MRFFMPSLFTLCLLICSCSSDQRVGVKGNVTYKGQAISNATIRFEADGKGSEGGANIENGAFVIPKDKGLLPGNYKVQINMADPKQKAGKDEAPGTGPIAKELLPRKYNLETTLKATVEAGKDNQVDFKLD
ncbi:MAG: carboxypeptidase regulatory-like domain-containing protein [Gemmataceae bacterium]|nr:carboxypeptidase regulatory-like domain-containing protein [Gemmataceae bacterium]